MTSSFTSAPRRRLVLLCCSLALLAFAGLSRADEMPTFSNPAATAFAQEYSAAMDQYVAVLKDYMAAIRANDTAKAKSDTARTKEMVPRISDLQNKGLQLQEKLNPDDKQKLADFMETLSKKMEEAGR